jgi:hypothetical protein
MDSLGTAEAVVTVSERVAPRAAAAFGVPRNRPVGDAGQGVVSGYRRCGRPRSLTVTAARSDVPPRDDILADRHDATYRDDPESRVREVVA